MNSGDSGWNGDEGDTDGKIPVVNPDGDNDTSWNGSEEDVDGNKDTTTNE